MGLFADVGIPPVQVSTMSPTRSVSPSARSRAGTDAAVQVNTDCACKGANGLHHSANRAMKVQQQGLRLNNRNVSIRALRSSVFNSSHLMPQAAARISIRSGHRNPLVSHKSLDKIF